MILTYLVIAFNLITIIFGVLYLIRVYKISDPNYRDGEYTLSFYYKTEGSDEWKFYSKTYPSVEEAMGSKVELTDGKSFTLSSMSLELAEATGLKSNGGEGE